MTFPFFKRYTVLGLLAGAGLAGLYACSPDDGPDGLGPMPTASFTVTPVADSINRYAIDVNATNAFSYQINAGDGSGWKTSAQKDTVYYSNAGEYWLKVRALGPGGFVTDSQKVTVDRNDCRGFSQLLTNCDSKTWVLMSSAPGALEVGPADRSMVWWSSDASVPGLRPCLFNDEATFTLDNKFKYDNKDDFWVDDEASAPWPTDIGLSVGCHPNSAIPSQYQAWTTNTTDYTFSLSGDGKSLTVTGTGAHLGLYKAGQNGTTATPEASVTYEVVELTADRLVVQKSYDWGYWKFTYQPKP